MVLLLTATLVVIADQITKSWIRTFSEGEIIFQSGFFRIIHVSNTGAAFGLFRDQSMFLTAVAFTGILLILILALSAKRLSFLNTTPDRIALGLILGGTIGNLMDRLRFGRVTDFIGVGIWPNFNVADSSVVIGVTLFAYLFLFTKKDNQTTQA